MDRETAKVEEEILEEVIRRDEAEIERDKKEVAEFRHKLEELKDSRRVEVIIGGHPYEMHYGEHTTVKELMAEALKKSGDEGRQVDDWQIKHDGRVLDENAKVDSYHLPCDAKLFMSVRAGHLG
jgi:hypothetical protein